MVGNDIVDMEQAELDSDWRRKGFLQKVFNQHEQQLIEQEEKASQMVWRLWSMKESAYKLYLQFDVNQKRIFNPSKISCEIISESKGRVCINETWMYTNTLCNANFIFTHASQNRLDVVDSAIVDLQNKDSYYQSAHIKEQLINHLMSYSTMNNKYLEIRKSKRNVPKIYYKNEELQMAVSLSHHGNFGAYSITKNQNDK